MPDNRLEDIDGYRLFCFLLSLDANADNRKRARCLCENI